MNAQPAIDTPVTRSESLVVRLRDRILGGEFPSGFHLQEVPLAEQMGVSRTPIREALALLAKEGLLEPGPKRGYKIRHFSVEDILEAYEVRATLEGMACRLLAERGLAEDEIRQLRDDLDLGDQMLERGMFTEAEHEPWLEMNNRFHARLVRGARNRTLADFVEQSQRVPLSSARHVHWYRLDPANFGLAQRAHRDHHEIVDAVVRRQAGRAEARMREHIYFSQDLVRQRFGHQQVGFDTAVAMRPSPAGERP